jgi:hypothetical protein
MNKFTYALLACVIALLLLSSVPLQAQVSVKDWGKTAQGAAWPVLNDATYPDGNATLGNGAIPTGWATIRGAFDQAYEATADQAVVVFGQMELVGGGGVSAYTHIRYALTYQDSSTLQYQYTDSAKWVSTKGHTGYSFQPRTGTGTMSNGNGGAGVVWTVNNGSWASTWSNNGLPISAVKQAPRNAEMVAGIYNWAISVQKLANGDNEIRWYMVEQNNKYWFGGTVIDTVASTAKFNGVCFGFNKDTETKQVKFSGVQVDLGEPITVPEAPWEPFYVNQWGKTAQGATWPVLNDSTYLDGDATLGNGAIPTGWATIRGGFGDPVQATAKKAIIVSGQMELVGGGGVSAYTHLRYALTYQDSSTLKYQYTDSAKWESTKGHTGYSFQPRTGTGTMSNGNGGAGVVWTVNNGSWASTWSNNGLPISAVKQAPRNAEMVAGIYNFAISVQPLPDGTNEIRWYMVEQKNKYWFGGTVIDKAASTTKFNGICFGFNKDTETKQVNFYAVEVDMGDPITVPEAPWEPFYVSQWGKTAQGTAWPVKNDSTYLDGDATLGNGAIPTGWATIRGGFGDPVQATAKKAIIVSGQMELVGGGGVSAYTHLRYALTYQDSSTLKYQYTDSAKWESTKGHTGYSFQPRTGTGTMSNGNGGAGVVWTVNNGSWASTWSNNGLPISAVKQAPRNAEMVAGIYNFAISVQPLPDGTNEIRWYMVEQKNKYWFGGTVIDTVASTTKFNGICFGFNKDTETKQVNFYAVQVDMGDPITVPEAPWEPFYVSQWGKTAQGTAWPVKNDSTYLDGDATLGNGAIPTGWATIRGGFGDPVQATAKKAIIVSGQMELVGGGGVSAYTHLRYALTYQDSSTLKYQYTDSAKWESTKGHTGYSFQPRTGTGTMSNGNGGAGVVWTVNNGSWASTWSNNGLPISAVKQAPRNAEMVAGIYNFAISVQPQADGSNEIRWYMIEKDNKYWFGGTVIDTVASTTKFNGICFGYNKDTEVTGVNFYAVQVDMGDPITVPEAPWEPYYVSAWGFVGGNIGGWKFTPGEFEGDATISGTVPPTSWSAVQGAFDSPHVPTAQKALQVTGKVSFDGGGFESAGSLKLGLMYSTTTGNVIATNPDSTRWSGVDPKHTGYLFIPVSGSNGPANWTGINAKGSYGAVVDHTWMNTDGASDYVLGSVLQHPSTAVGGAGTYDFGISVQPLGNGTSEVRVKLIKSDGSYAWAAKVIDLHSPLVTEQFNGILLGLNTNAATTAMNIMEVQVDMGAPIELPDWVVAVNMPEQTTALPTVYALGQNYPNPFNPTTTIELSLPKRSEVKLVVYDALGKVVAELAEGTFNAGIHKINFNAINLSSGIYFYKLTAGEYTSTKKLMLLK